MLRELAHRRKPTSPAAKVSAAGHEVVREHSHTKREQSLSPIILVVERDRLLRWALYETLAEAGFRVLTAPEGLCATALIDQIDQDLSLAIVDDESWPLTESVRAPLHQRWPTLPIVVMFQSRGSTAEERARAHRATDVLEKPFDLQRIVLLAGRLTGRAGTPVSPSTSDTNRASQAPVGRYTSVSHATRHDPRRRR